jgi:hypothetical protein
MKCWLLSFLCISLVNININAQMKENKFKIYCFDKEYEIAFNLAPYDYGDSWHIFMNNADLNKAITIINDIEEYQWEKQIIKLNQSAYDFIQNMEFISHMKFIVTLNEERIYAGEFISFFLKWQ